MITYISKRIGLAFLTFISLVFVVYMLEATFGLHPFYSSADSLEPSSNRTDTGDIQAKLIEEYLLNKPPIIRFFKWLGDLFSGNFGPVYKKSINIELPLTFLTSFKWTLLITVPSFILSVFLGISIGTLSAYKRGKMLDTSIVVASSVIAAIPIFVLAPVIIIFTYRYMNLPLEFQRPDAERGIGWDSTIKSVIAPIFVITITGLSGFAIYTRNQMVNVLTSNHVLIAKAKGLSGWKLFYKHILRNASLPIMAMVIPGYIGFLSGSIVLERFFGVPGSAQVILEAQKTGEINVVMFGVMFYSVLTLLTSVIVDVMYGVLDPQIKFTANNSDKSFVKRYTSFLTRKKVFAGVK